MGSWGSISSRINKTDDKGRPIRYLSKANFRDHDGHVRDVTATGRTKSASEASSSESSRTGPGPTSPATSVHSMRGLPREYCFTQDASAISSGAARAPNLTGLLKGAAGGWSQAPHDHLVRCFDRRSGESAGDLGKGVDDLGGFGDADGVHVRDREAEFAALLGPPYQIVG